MKNKILGLLIVTALFILSACNETDNQSVLKIRLTDAPGDYEEVNVQIQSMEYHFSSDEEGDWIQLNSLEVGVYNLLDFNNGLDTLIASEAIGSGTISQLRLHLGENNSVKINGKEYDLKIPSGQQSGIKIILVEGPVCFNADSLLQMRYICRSVIPDWNRSSKEFS